LWIIVNDDYRCVQFVCPVEFVIIAEKLFVASSGLIKQEKNEGRFMREITSFLLNLV
jgi:hypothetical protein